MKIFDSGMPNEEMWLSFFNTDRIFAEMGIESSLSGIADFGAGYGTFSIPASYVISGKVFAFDIEQESINYIKQRCQSLGIRNIDARCCDFISDGTSLPEEFIDYVMLFNIMHHNEPGAILAEAIRILKPGGMIGVIHWRSDIETPRGPSLQIRPKPENVIEWAGKFNLTTIKNTILPPYHYGVLLKK